VIEFVTRFVNYVPNYFAGGLNAISVVLLQKMTL